VVKFLSWWNGCKNKKYSKIKKDKGFLHKNEQISNQQVKNNCNCEIVMWKFKWNRKIKFIKMVKIAKTEE
jgi:hypothetical protein